MPSDCSTTSGRTARNTALAPTGPPPARLVRLFAIACGSAVANVYFAQPLLVTLGERFSLGSGLLGAIVTVTQAGYAAGLFLLVPLGDLADRRRLITLQLGLLAAALLAVALAPGTAVLLAALAMVGALAVVAQTMVAAAAHLAAPAFRGRVVGAVTSGVITGILLARTVAGVLADLAGWRSVYLFSAAVTATLAVLLRRALPAGPPPSARLPYRHLLASTVALFARNRLLRVRGALALLVFAAFSTLWSSVVQPLSSPPWSLSHTAIGAFGLAGAAGALAAGVAGRWNDRGLAQRTTGTALVLLALSWLPLAFTRQSLWALAAGTVLLDFAVQAVHVTNQTLIHAVRPDAGSRIIGGYMIFYSAGSALGATGSSLAYAAAGWTGVSALGAAFSCAALLLWATTRTP
ncbi:MULTISPECIES: MFS transporter [Streptomyces]|uniref:MFS transporter n=1 Tax=Streptomyces TaxID=1883 RepID=UPI00167AB486|nr:MULTISPECIES: MFS transporter [Streptomyces]MBK3522335.1 MFS transporter [Streptomyces sp. MBT70]GGR70273.1 MFS transporter [Streptomyces eurythermus]